VTGGKPDETAWQRSSSCQGGACVEVTSQGDRIAIRDSRNPSLILTFSATNWRDFVVGVKDGEFGCDRLTKP